MTITDADRLARLILAITCTALSSCYYGFSGTSLPEHVETVAIPVTDVQARAGLPDLGDQFTEFLIDRFVSRTRLKLVSNEYNADTILTSTLDRYTNRPASVGGDERASLNRVTVSVTVSYTDRLKNVQLLPPRSFTAFGEYDPVEDGIDGEEEAASEALRQLAEDVFNASASGW